MVGSSLKRWPCGTILSAAGGAGGLMQCPAPPAEGGHEDGGTGTEKKGSESCPSPLPILQAGLGQ